MLGARLSYLGGGWTSHTSLFWDQSDARARTPIFGTAGTPGFTGGLIILIFFYPQKL